MTPRFAPFVLAAVAIALTAGGPVHSATKTDMATATATVAALAKLSLSAATVSFPDADPGTVPLIPSSGGAITIITKVRTTAGGEVRLSVQASDDLRSGINMIRASQVTWTATGAGFVEGTMDSSLARSAGAWVGSGTRTGMQSYFLTNSWDYAPGAYTTTFMYTLTAP